MSEFERLQQKLITDLPSYAAACLNIQTKNGLLAPFFLNKPQQIIHEALERQLAETGRVRAIVLKARQQGCSTYIGARYFWKVANNVGKKCFVLTHQQKSTDALFNMVDTFYSNLPVHFKPTTKAANAKELVFGELNSGYSIGTAGSSEVGRGMTIQLLHASETAFWQNPEKIAAGLLQAVPPVEGSEIIFESTANGLGNYFHKLYQGAISGENEYQLIFIPWFLSDEYATPAPLDWHPSIEEIDYGQLYNLSREQLYWRHLKIKELPAGLPQFNQEYPSCPEDAFQAANHRPFIPIELARAAAKPKGILPSKRVVIGIDPAYDGEKSDRTAIVVRSARRIEEIIYYRGKDSIYTTGRVMDIINRYDVLGIYVDMTGGYGIGVFDSLKSQGKDTLLRGINFASGSYYPDKYPNKRVEIWDGMKTWLSDDNIEIPDDLGLISDLTCISIDTDGQGRVALESKHSLKKRGFESPDIADALALTFAEPFPEGNGNISVIQGHTYVV